MTTRHNKYISRTLLEPGRSGKQNSPLSNAWVRVYERDGAPMHNQAHAPSGMRTRDTSKPKNLLHLHATTCVIREHVETPCYCMITFQ